MRGVLNLAVMIAAGVMLADVIANPQGAQALFNGIGSLWQMSINGMLGKSSGGGQGGGAATHHSGHRQHG